MDRRTKIVCTLGPAVASADGILRLVEDGMDVARLNFSHGDHPDHEQNYKWVREAAEKTGRAVGILADLQGPKIRLGRFTDGATVWENGETIRITVDDVEGTHDRVSTTYKNLAKDAKPGDRLLVDDGKVGLVCVSVEGNDVICEVVEGGPVSNNKGVSLPGMDISVPALSEKDIRDLRFALKLGVDFIALSFVRSPADAELVHKIMDEEGRRVPVIAKLEKPEAVTSLEPIVLAFDAVMVARGDLGVEVPLEEVPLVQKRAIQIARENAKPVIVATQMLDSMIENSRPTRAEASDVANAVLDGADAVMLSGETSVGKDPHNVVRTMSRIVRFAETDGRVPDLTHIPRTKRGVISYSARDIAERLNARALVAFTTSGDTAKRVARLHSHLPLLVFTPNEAVRSELALTWGATTFLCPPVSDTDDMMREVDRALLAMPEYNKGDMMVVVAGSPPGVTGNTNMIHVHLLGDDTRIAKL
ncbi:pyruvate kinase [Corynebacterium glutamicum MB001]|uniref:Pyruvate kinase n=1 Tax=Corynebacterium glutamicum (strain ATCC 13032 / DSM 20300 / JCM 1318 / BCRC 11384 / CCUG 27702 / LMG 3730 / NBRC 12168 / NCIMB 10025 / NRRL B-2784 / 534) TaxID=196627 RepID=KPYK_CORGL|nr:pyruvate kinase [Corynebacterium glutamicum]Q46078.1 RecName: Full=Pyruvate kinase; Short=PK [Corynebacterium glutamicum ATCC 13032]AAA56793.1 pyruvate kinase [Corynebacterium glutamicum]AGT05824.1 pyruvate kinase [Corynebacterium glutamicum MB001]ASW14474.1 pyruvate kinase [Corynebacterium glutamicum]AUI02567.1 pyruvate kinase [Corynebacterium glutamicum]AUI05625.1 pyruvate kinase [Corynebacterium glutamicum]